MNENRLFDFRYDNNLVCGKDENLKSDKFNEKII